ncbi:ATP-binding response regulator [Desulfonatronovibrio magnus]|uniref:ATP-binding response regulator n=1 Tax=Desulfonatronovibrio magnus TaxID=698827 RepID=UPI0006980C0E|nr:hybrid sensor histidine kinase/response regulator [Desulfonatronovibrio magnus]
MIANNQPRVLIVDDEPANIQLLLETLKHDYIVTAAKNGEKALSMACSEKQPDIILLDIVMPGMDGYIVCKELKDREETRDIPVIFISALDDELNEQKGLSLGAVDYITKPFNPAIVKARVRNHLELHRSRRELSRLFRCVENSADTIVVTDTEANIEYANPAFTQKTGYTLEEARGKKPSILKSGMHDNAFYADMWQVITSGRVWSGEVLNKKKNGDLYWEEASIAPVKNARGEIINYVAVKKDISLRKDLERMKEDVERIMRHDLKTPLSGIVGLPQLLLDDDNLTTEQEEMVRMIIDSGLRMLRMIDMSLDLFKMETGDYVCTHRNVEVRAVLQTVLDEIEPAFESKNIEVVINKNLHKESDSFWVKGEEHLFYGILSNLIKNAFEASPKGQQVKIDLVDLPSPTISIENKGVVPLSIRQHFFQKYMTYGKKRGTGLGTYSARLMATTMGYDLKLSTCDTKGTTTLTLSAPSNFNPEPVRILI